MKVFLTSTEFSHRYNEVTLPVESSSTWVQTDAIGSSLHEILLCGTDKKKNGILWNVTTISGIRRVAVSSFRFDDFCLKLWIQESSSTIKIIMFFWRRKNNTKDFEFHKVHGHLYSGGDQLRTIRLWIYQTSRQLFSMEPFNWRHSFSYKYRIHLIMHELVGK